MAKTARPSPSLVPAIFALIILVVLGYLLFSDSKPSRTEHTLSPPIEVDEPLEEEVIETDGSGHSIDQQKLRQEEAEMFVEQLAEPDSNGSVTVTEDGGEFVRHDGHITIPDLEKRHTTVQQIIDDDSLADDTPITVDYTEISRITTTLAELDTLVEDKTVPILVETEDGRQIEAPLADLLTNPSLDQNAPLTVITQQRISETLSKSQLASSGIALDQKVDATISHGSKEFDVKDIVKAPDLADGAMFYLHRVTEKDKQGLWGIIQAGLIERFREGLVLEGIKLNKDRLRVTIPADADEPLPTGLSSFLGKVLNEKVVTSYIYNFNTDTMGHDPNLIYPGQQLILIHFTTEELETIYSFFAAQRRENAKSFAIQP